MEAVATKPVWNKFHLRWAKIKPPLRPHLDVATEMHQLLQQHNDHVLLLGVTPELSDLGIYTTALDRSAEMIDHIWPGDCTERQATQGNWLQPAFDKNTFSAVIGDGALSCINYPHDYQQLFQSMSRVIKPGGRMILRLFASPDTIETMDDVIEAVFQHQIEGFHAFKWRVAMAVVQERKDPNIPVHVIHQRFNQCFANRQALAEVTGWSFEEIAEMDAYQHSPEVYSFPTIAQIKEALPDYCDRINIVSSGDYELSERCPLLVVDFPDE